MLNDSQDQPFQWMAEYNNSHGGPDIKVEALPEPFSLLSPPLSPSLPLSFQRRRSTGSTSSPKRSRPYTLLPRNLRSRIDEMATTPAYWASPSNARGSGSRAPTNERRASDGQQLMYNTSQYSSMPVMPQMYGVRPSHRSPSSGSSGGTSSLTGAMGETPVPSSRHSGSPPPVRDSLFNMTMGQPIGWGQSTSMNTSEPAYGMPYVVDQQTSYPYRNSPESLSPTSFNDPSSPPYTPQTAPLTAQDAEIRRLRKRVRDLEQANERAHEQIKAFGSGSSARALPSPLSTPPMSTAFQASWKARTEARVHKFCALNRAGNALCAWHDSRRERRAYPPRMAPPGVLNCGCTFEEALFEESLARQRVGSYHPGDSVRMDPALRNPLLKLLQSRYNYRDGDFERDPRTGEWIQGEGHAYWEQQLQSGTPNPRRHS
ncbi:hypothetical protein FB45DRAFT_454424 [Roridomyces roridus]|uniref:Uncharacterized protein n=1 Tax=Roridomyces roridus TaxID=1738132 RepID=A0AAD7C2D0_9AGAR|nr:hypothetical protein FB45DRAFT_454424 [Roridomyces roridus]